MVLGKSGPGELGPGQLGPGQSGPGQLGPGPNCPGPNCPPLKNGQLGPGQLGPGPNCPGPNCPGPSCPGPDSPGPNLPRIAGTGPFGQNLSKGKSCMTRFFHFHCALHSRAFLRYSLQLLQKDKLDTKMPSLRELFSCECKVSSERNILFCIAHKTQFPQCG